MLLKVRPGLVRLAACSPEEDCFVEWLHDLGVWNFELECRCRAAKNFVPLDMEYDIKDILALPFDKDTKTLFSNLIASSVGISASKYNIGDGCDCFDPETSVGKLLNLQLARVQDNCRFKAKKIAFDPRIQYLVGYRKSPN